MTSRLLEEACEAPHAVARLLAADEEQNAALAAVLRDTPPRSMLTIARGSSDHAAHYAAYLIMARLGHLVTSLPMSLVTLYHARIRCDGLVALAFSQSGRSPDLIEPIRVFRAGGACSIAYVNDIASPLANAAQWTFGLHCGPEISVAATKSYIAQLTAAARLVALWQRDETLQLALGALPAALDRALDQDWQRGVEALAAADRLLVVSRGLGLPIALEAALKLKEVCGIQAEAFSGAELRHGPLALVETGYAVLILAPAGVAHAGLVALADDLRRRGGSVLLAAPTGTPGADLSIASCGADELDPIGVAQSLYPMVDAIARARGLDPDAPRHLAKVTLTH